jgi:hypothetical protein
MHLEVLLPGIVSFAKQQLPVGGISVTDGEFQPHWFKGISSFYFDYFVIYTEAQK